MTVKKKTMKQKITNIFTYEPPKGQKFTRPSLTVPDETMTLRELIDRHSRGLPIAPAGAPIFLGDNGVGIGFDISKLDLADQQELKEEAARELKEIHDKITSDKKLQLEATQAAKIKEIEERLKHDMLNKDESTNTP